MPYVSAKYMQPDPLDPPDLARAVTAVDEQGQVWSFREDSQVGDWLNYIAGGGVIDEADPLPPPSVPEPELAKAEPDVTYGVVPPTQE
jgi:hypothetical protein